MKKVLLVAASCLLVIFSPAQEKPKITRYGLVLDQDLLVEKFGLRNEDRNYTMGLGFFLGNNQWGDAALFRPFRWVAKKTARGFALKNFKTDQYEVEQTATLSFGVTAFTPEYLGDRMDSLYYIVNDRPFSSLMFLSAKYHTATRKKVETNQLVLGMLGLGIAREAQTYIHENHWFGSTRPIPYGWKYQVSAPGEFTVLLSNRADILLNDVSSFETSRLNNINTQFIFMREYQLGYYTGISSGIAMRIGLLDPYNWTSYDTYLLNYASSFLKKENSIDDERRRLRPELYFQASLKPHLFLYNAHLQGQFREKRYDYIHYPPIQPFVVEGFAGIGATVPNAKKNFAVNLLFYASGRTAEIKSPLSRIHSWGGVQLCFVRIKPR